MNSLVLHELVFANPMLEHTARRGRKFFRMCTRVAGYLRVGMAVFLYFGGLAILIMGRTTWATDLQFVEMVVITLIIQISTYAAISGERERATWESLILSRLSVAQILSGQLLWRMVIIVALLGIFMVPMILIPVIDIASWSADIPALLGGQVLIFVWVVFACALCLWTSANSRRSATSAGITGVLLAGLMVLAPLVSGLFQESPAHAQDNLFLIFNPLHALSAHISFNESSGPNMYGGGPYLYSSDPSKDPSNTFRFQPFWCVVAAYSCGAIAFLSATHRSLRRLEEPGTRHE